MFYNMVNAKQCDICKTFFIRDEEKDLVLHYCGHNIDICDKCYTSLDKFFKGEYKIVTKAKVQLSDEQRKQMSDRMKAFNANRKRINEDKIEKELRADGVWHSDDDVLDEDIKL